jgi:ABC-type phosphate/phosphonate transport system substrate-binding protein
MNLARLLRAVAQGLLACLLTGTASAAPPTTETLRIAVHMGALRDASRADVEVSLKLWSEEMAKVLEVPAEMRLYTSLVELSSDMKDGRANFVIADGVNLLRHFEPEELVDGFGGRGHTEDNLVLLVRKAAGIRSMKDLAGQRVVLLSGNEISDLWLETACLRALRQSCRQAALTISKENRSAQQVLKLFFSKADAALVRGYAYELAVELNPQIRDQVQVIERIPIYPGALGLFSSRISLPFREYVIGKIPTLQNYPRGRQIMEVLQAERIDRLPRTVLEPIRQLMYEHATLSARYALGKSKP